MITTEAIDLLAFTTGELPGDLLSLPEGDLLIVRGFYNSAVLAGADQAGAIDRAKKRLQGLKERV
jgi:hypothetical protein